MHYTNRIVPAVALGIASIFMAASPSFGAPITYTEQATASGTLNGTPFTDATVLLTMNNNTTNVTNGPPGLFFNQGTVTLSIGGGPAVTFTDPTHVFSNQNSPAGVGFEDVGSSEDILDTLSASFATYDLTTSIGPIVGSSVINAGISFPTTGGALVLTSAGDATFTSVASETNAIPEPSTWAMMLIGFAGLGYAGYRRARAAHATRAA
jgi:PEP-CTERM motif